MSEYCVAGIGTQAGVQGDGTSNQIRGRLGAREGMERGGVLWLAVTGYVRRTLYINGGSPTHLTEEIVIPVEAPPFASRHWLTDKHTFARHFNWTSEAESTLRRERYPTQGDARRRQPHWRWLNCGYWRYCYLFNLDAWIINYFPHLRNRFG